jgi:creatinine amidohydrolase
MTEIHWSRMRASEINALAKRDTVVIVPVASTEQHGPHLPTQVDCLLVGAIAERAARQTTSVPVIVAPTIWSGLAEHHMSLGATLSLDYPAFFGLLHGICRSIVRDGFNRVLLLNGHGGNTAALTVAVNELSPQLGVPIATTTYWLLAQDAFGKILEKQANVRHACEAETSMVLALAPDLVDTTLLADAVGPTAKEIGQIVGTKAHRWQSFKARTTHGAIGDPTTASAAKGERLLVAAAEAVAKLVTNEDFWNLPA